VAAPSVLVVGGAGYVGAHAVRALLRAGVRVSVLDDLSTGHRALVPDGVPLHVGSVSDRAALAGALATAEATAVMHFAARSLVGESMQAPRRYFEENCGGALALGAALLDAGVDKLIFSSTAAVFGEPDAVPIADGAPRRPGNPYGVTKAFIEDLLEAYTAHGLSSVALRYFNAAGAEPDGSVGEHHAVETHLVPLVLDAALGVRPHVTLFGSDYPTRDGTGLRDYVHVSDLADAHVAALAHLEGLTQPAARRMNLGSGTGTTVREVIDTVRAVTGLPVTANEGPRRPGDPAALVASAAGAGAWLGWRPKRGEITTIIEDAWRWHRRLRAERI
jgi:UDP-glucose 4-epimerase